MWAEACELVERAERLQRQFFEPLAVRRVRPQPSWAPPVDVVETPEHLWILVALPGVPADRVEVGVEHGTLVVAGERPMPGGERPAVIRRLEIPYGRFERQIELPPGRFEIDRRDLIDGCLVLGLRKSPVKSVP